MIDAPAFVVDFEGTKSWYQNGQLHRTDGPAIEWADGSKSWYQNGQRHRTDGPASEWADGSKSWYQNGQLHRTDGPASEYANGSKEWYLWGHQLSGLEYTELNNDPHKLMIWVLQR